MTPPLPYSLLSIFQTDPGKSICNKRFFLLLLFLGKCGTCWVHARQKTTKLCRLLVVLFFKSKFYLVHGNTLYFPSGCTPSLSPIGMNYFNRNKLTVKPVSILHFTCDWHDGLQPEGSCECLAGTQFWTRGLGGGAEAPSSFIPWSQTESGLCVLWNWVPIGNSQLSSDCKHPMAVTCQIWSLLWTWGQCCAGTSDCQLRSHCGEGSITM